MERDDTAESPAPSDEHDLTLRARSGDRDAFGVLVQRHMRRAYFAALALVGSHDDALDLSQEAFARVFVARSKLDPDRPFYPWFYQALRRLCFNFLRDRRNRRRLLEERHTWLVPEDPGSGAGRDPLAQIEAAEARTRVERAIDTLPERQREVLTLREFEGLRYREIAGLLDVPIGTVMSRLYGARRSLAAALEQEEIERDRA